MAENTIKIAKVSCRIDRLGSSLSYEKIFSQAIQSIEWKGVKNASKLIDKELRENGFKPVDTNKRQAKPDKSSSSRGDVKTGNTRKSKRNTRHSKE